MSRCYTNISSTYSERKDSRPSHVSSPDDVMAVIKAKAQKYGIDWRWLAAMAYVESNLVTNARNSKGYCGLFQWNENRKDIAHILGKDVSDIGNIYDVDLQTEASAKRMAANVNDSRYKGLNGDDCYLYAGICHNAGEGGAGFILSRSMPKTVRQMSKTIMNVPSSEIKWDWMKKKEKRDEISTYPQKMKAAYDSIVKKYG